MKEQKDWLIAIIIAAVIALGVRTFIFETYIVDGDSMQPTFQTNNHLIVDKVRYRLHKPVKGDILVFKYPADPSRQFIKRVIATEGDTVAIMNGQVIVNDQILSEPYVLEKTEDNYHTVTIPKGRIFVLGDNRNNSEDSRFPHVGLVSLDLIQGQVLVEIWPLNELRTF